MHLVAEGWDDWWAPEGATTQGLVALTVLNLAVFMIFDRTVWLAQPLLKGAVDTSSKRQRLFMVSTFHAVVVTVYALYKVCIVGREDTTGNREFMTFTLAYFINDSIGSVSEWVDHPSEFVHHALAIGVTLSGGLMVPEVSKHVPAFLLVEGSTPFYNATWFLKKNGKANTTIFSVLTATFVLLFFALRIVWLPYSVFDVMVRHTSDFYKMGILGYALVPICFLQMWWFYQICAKVAGMLNSKSSGDEAAVEKKSTSPDASAAAQPTPDSLKTPAGSSPGHPPSATKGAEDKGRA